MDKDKLEILAFRIFGILLTLVLAGLLITIIISCRHIPEKILLSGCLMALAPLTIYLFSIE